MNLERLGKTLIIIGASGLAVILAWALVVMAVR